MSLPPLSELAAWKTTRDALHAYSRVLGAIREDILPEHPKWWHGSLRPGDNGLTTSALPNSAAGETLELSLDLVRHRAEVRSDTALVVSVDLTESPSGTELGAELLGHLRGRALAVEPAAKRWQNGTRHRYEPVLAEGYLGALGAVHEVFAQVRSRSDLQTSAVQFWPHHFDLSCELFGTRRVPSSDGSEETDSQVGLGFSTGDSTYPDAYFYANPWPFEPRLTEVDLPGAARWLEEPWQGSLLPYAGSSAVELDAYLTRVLDAATPYLRAP